MSAVVHSFAESLERSAGYIDAPWWMEIYRAAFPDLQSAVSVRQDGWAQRGGIDRVLTLASGKTLTVDEKVREKDWPDILLERYSSLESKTPGWMHKDLACDFIAYAFAPSQTCYLLPFQTLRRAWMRDGADWWSRYPKVSAKNAGYTTVSVAVPIPVVMAAMTDAMRIVWGAA